MSSQSPLQVIVYDSPEHEHPAVCRAMESFGLATDWGLPGGLTKTKQVFLHLGQAYGTHHAPLGASDDLAARLRADAPETTFLLWQDPYFEEADGHNVAHVPEVGVFESPCNANGAPHIDLSELIASLRETPALTTAQWLAGPGETILGTRVRKVIDGYERPGIAA
ncbi:hypothetical protein ABZV31_37120 [Streptomyces sp. NPDC005202]|uniref:hypothetical protein n=1 Tax=Streptomyces sp. NPDC005202 TaxID=3157021 RepID=UPI0033BEA9DE